MKQYDVFENPSPVSRAYAPFVVVLQSHHLRAVETVVIAPLVIDAEPSLKHIDIPVRLAGRDLWVAVAEMSNAPIRSLRNRRGDLRAHEDEISRAIARIFTGF